MRPSPGRAVAVGGRSRVDHAVAKPHRALARRSCEQLVEAIDANTFGNTYRGSVLETIVSSIAEQRQIFKGADHAFLWKPKLRIPDIYENRENQVAFGRFLDVCSCCKSEEAIVAAIRELDRKQIKGLGPAAANLLYFLHPTLCSGATGLPSQRAAASDRRLDRATAPRDRPWQCSPGRSGLPSRSTGRVASHRS